MTDKEGLARRARGPALPKAGGRAARAPSMRANFILALRTRRLRNHRRSSVTKRWSGLSSIEPRLHVLMAPLEDVPNHPHDDDQEESGADQEQGPFRGVVVVLSRSHDGEPGGWSARGPSSTILIQPDRCPRAFRPERMNRSSAGSILGSAVPEIRMRKRRHRGSLVLRQPRRHIQHLACQRGLARCRSP